MMASAASVASTVNTSTNTTPSTLSAQRDGSNRSVKQNSGNKMTEKSRKESPVDSNRRSAASKAWSVSSPTTQRASTPSQQKGNNNQNKNVANSSKAVNTKDQALSDQQNHDRLRFLLGGTIGLTVVFTTRSGDKFEGIFSGYSGTPSNAKITLKMTKKIQNTPITQPNGVGSWEAAFAGSSPDHALSFELRDMADMTIPEFSIPDASRQANGASTSFQTDTDISGSSVRGERVLQRWVPDVSGHPEMSLDSTSTSGWDQFETHEKMTGGRSTYTEETYTTAIDRSAPDFKRREAEAARIAREIESQTSTNAHVMEERGHAAENDYADEEDKYSGVRRTEFLPLAVGSANRYTPPAMRAPTAQATTTGVPVDSAIISAQLARPVGSRSTTSNQPAQVKNDVATNDQLQSHNRADAVMPPEADELPVADQSTESVSLAANGSLPKTVPARPPPSTSPQRQADTETPSQGVENKVLDQFRQFANSERARLAERKRAQASQDRTAKFNDLVRFSKTFKLKTPIPNDLVGILAKDPRKQEQIMEKAQRDHEEAKSTPATTQSAPSSTQLPPVPKFDKSQIPPPIPERNTFNNGRGSYGKQSLTRAQRPLGQQLPFSTGTVPLAPRGQAVTLREKNGPIPAPIPMPEISRSTTTSADKSGLSSPRGTETPTSAVSTKFNVRATEFRPTFQTAPSVSAASPSPIARTASVARSASPSSFFGQRKPKPAAERTNIMANFNPIERMKKELQVKRSEKSDEPVRDYAGNGGIPNAYHTQPTWIVSDANKEKTYDDLFTRAAPPAASPAQSRSNSNQTVPFHGQMQQMPTGPHMQALAPQHGHHGGNHYQPHYEDQRLHMQNSSPQVFASPSMTPRNMYASPIGHPAQAYAHQSYFGAGGPVPMRPYGNNPAMMHSQHSQMGAPMMVAQQSNGPFIGVPGSFQGMMYPSPTPGHVYPQQNGFPSPGRMAPVMMHQNSQQGHLGHQQLIYSNPGHTAGMYGQQSPMGRGYGGNHTSYGTSPHQPHHLNQRAMSSGYPQKNISQMTANNGPPANAPQQPAAFSQMPVSDDGK